MMRTLRIPLLLACIVVLAGFLRLYHLDRLPPGLYPDEAMNGNNALEAITTGNYKVFYPENNGREGLFINIQAFVLKFFMARNGGLTEPWMLRVTSAFFGTLTVLGMYFLGRELFRESLNDKNQSAKRIELGTLNFGISRSQFIGLASSFFLATSFWHINFSRIGFRAISAPFFLVWGFALLLIAIRIGRERKVTMACLLSMLSGIVFGLGFHTYIAYRIAPVLLLAVAYFFRREPSFWKIAAVFLLGAFLAGLPIGLYYLQHPADFMGRTTQVSVFSSASPLKDLGLNIVKTLGMFNVTGDGNARHNIPGSPELFWPVGILFLIGIPLVLKKFWRKFSHAFVVLMFVLFMLPVVISNEGLPHALRAILLLPPVMLTTALGAEWVFEKLGSRVNGQAMAAVVGFAAAFLIANANIAYFRTFANHPDTPGAFAADYVETGRAIRGLPRSDAKFVIVEAGGVDVRGIPMPAQTIMFLTQSFTDFQQFEKNIYYVLPNEEDRIPPGAAVFRIK